MYVSMLRFKFHLDALNAVHRIWKECIVPELKRQNGWKDAAFRADDETGQGMVFCLWETEDQANGLELTDACKRQMLKLVALSIETPSRQVYALDEQEPDLAIAPIEFYFNVLAFSVN